MIVNIPLRYTAEHKLRTHTRILRQAGRLFRRHGYRGVGIDRIMGAAGLTRGGFYAHFRSKDALFAEVLAGRADFVERLEAAPRGDAATNAEGACAVIAGYLDPANREKVARGCTLATLTNEVPRAGRAAKAAYARSVDRLARAFEERVPPHLPDRRERALRAVGLCVGGIGLARGAGDDALAHELLAVCREQACAAIRGECAPPRAKHRSGTRPAAPP